jgi:hypothetical protein
MSFPFNLTGAMSRNLEKHARYATAYQRGGWFWGLGVEHETYLATTQTRTVRAVEALAMRPERYSVNYYAAYRPGALRAALDRTLVDASSGLILPVLVNSHSFTHCDVFGEHRTTYERVPKPNPRFGGRTMEEWARDYSPWLRDEVGQAYMWDGDTVEFMTQQFYCATIDRVVAELEAAETRFNAEMASLPRTGILTAYGPLRLATPRNEPFATYLTHPRGVAMFNNGTIHVNVTLPTRLGWNRMPLWPRDFLEGHRCLARLVQWLEPLWVARFGSGDPFAVLGEVRDVCDGRVGRFAAGSQRLAVSRYIGMGTFDTDRMPTGKILQVPRSTAGALPWYDWLYERTHYAALDVVGLDLNYNKHWAHGLELRFFDQMAVTDLRVVLEQLAVLCDVALAAHRGGAGVPNPRQSPIWIAAAGEALLEGIGWRVPAEYLNAMMEAAGAAPEAKEPLPVVEALDWLVGRLRRVGDGYCVSQMGAGAEAIQITRCGC